MTKQYKSKGIEFLCSFNQFKDFLKRDRYSYNTFQKQYVYTKTMKKYSQKKICQYYPYVFVLDFQCQVIFIYRYITERVGATCWDGSHSYATGRGACSWHGGVREWLHETTYFLIAVVVNTIEQWNDSFVPRQQLEWQKPKSQTDKNQIKELQDQFLQQCKKQPAKLQTKQNTKQYAK